MKGTYYLQVYWLPPAASVNETQKMLSHVREVEEKAEEKTQEKTQEKVKMLLSGASFDLLYVEVFEAFDEERPL